ncbi:MvaI/BcnI family restriction endonuclease [Noviherbaspirillum galbum]|uniref:MvaI/BcnI restriction endonuclease domain-containing protein n=1 Tax=Noviherbaspirillum galbum TaxID=2709383 RepID=A0A6B3SPA7_9BURK|nr:MvaI/BcnI family restriction endonuclease [Noviherbaspirillum galbum]NEX62471.1 hypothetical protein [Noviherbaspirillum galbum]
MDASDVKFPSSFEHVAASVEEIAAKCASFGADLALLKLLPRNANDKNQIYLASDFGLLYDLFDLTLAERGMSTSETKGRSAPGTRIPEAVFNSFSWAQRDGALIPARRVKAIIYPQYPEARLSGFQTVNNTIPQSLTVGYTKEHSAEKRLLVLARTPRGKCVGLVYFRLSAKLEREIEALPGFERARACKRLTINQGNTAKLEAALATVLGRSIPGCRLDAYGRSLPFSGTQVCGYTLEHELGIVPNSGSDGDLFGIELKTHTQVKVTLFTPEPDGGLYAKDFVGFMNKYGYRDANGDLRFTGIHRANKYCPKSKLTLQIREFRIEDEQIKAFPYNPDTPLTPKMDSIEVALIAGDDEVAASWSLERLMNCWGAKHNEVVYIPAEKLPNSDVATRELGYVYTVTFGTKVMWCRDTSAERLLQAINDGVIFLDPAPKLHATDHGQNKRRAQWRVNDITKAAQALYSIVEFKSVAASNPHIKALPVSA